MNFDFTFIPKSTQDEYLRCTNQTSEALSGIAGKFAMTVLMSNCVGFCDDFESVGKTSVWNAEGISTGQLDDENEGILIVNTETGEVLLIRKSYKISITFP